MVPDPVSFDLLQELALHHEGLVFRPVVNHVVDTEVEAFVEVEAGDLIRCHASSYHLLCDCAQLPGIHGFETKLNPCPYFLGNL